MLETYEQYVDIFCFQLDNSMNFLNFRLQLVSLLLQDLETKLTLSFLVLSDKPVTCVYLLLASVHFLHQVSPIFRRTVVKLAYNSRHLVSLALFSRDRSKTQVLMLSRQRISVKAVCISQAKESFITTHMY